MGRRMTPNQHEMTADARHWKRRKAEEEEREMRNDQETLTRVTEFERGVRAGVENMTMYFQDENEFSIYEGLSDAHLAQHAEGAIQQALQDEKKFGSESPAVTEAMVRAASRAFWDGNPQFMTEQADDMRAALEAALKVRDA